MDLPAEWASDADRGEGAGVPEGVGFATRVVLARRMIDRAVAAGPGATWGTADAAYGPDAHARATVEGRGPGYVVGGRADFAVRAGVCPVRATAPLTQVPADAWHRRSLP